MMPVVVSEARAEAADLELATLKRAIDDHIGCDEGSILDPSVSSHIHRVSKCAEALLETREELSAERRARELAEQREKEARATAEQWRNEANDNADTAERIRQERETLRRERNEWKQIAENHEETIRTQAAAVAEERRAREGLEKALDEIREVAACNMSGEADALTFIAMYGRDSTPPAPTPAEPKLQAIAAVAASLPTDPDDEAIVDALKAKRPVVTRPLVSAPTPAVVEKPRPSLRGHLYQGGYCTQCGGTDPSEYDCPARLGESPPRDSGGEARVAVAWNTKGPVYDEQRKDPSETAEAEGTVHRSAWSDGSSARDRRMRRE